MPPYAPQPPPERPASPRKRKRRAIQACERCRQKKYKCDESWPCFHCAKSGLQCTYPGGPRHPDDPPTASYIQSLETRIKELTARLEIKEDSSPNSQQRLFALPLVDRTRGPAGSPDESELTDVNQHTNAIEFYGSTSSIAFLGQIQKLRGNRVSTAEDTPSLVSTLHNSAFSPHSAAITSAKRSDNFYFKQAHVFMDAYFGSIHFIHPFIDKEDFVSRANDLWFGRSAPPDASFMALYLSLLSVGALVRTWDEEQLDGLTRFEWSRRLFNEAQAYLVELQFSTDLETVQSLYLMASPPPPLCPNQVPKLSYMYLGLAVRTCLSAGFNRESSNPKNKDSIWLSRAWWGLFSQEIEMSFSLGRPDTLGMDEYHNRRIPEPDDSEYAIIPCMVTFAYIIRKVSIGIYHSNSPVEDTISLALEIEEELDVWLRNLPDNIRPSPLRPPHMGALREPKWCRRQRLVLEIRYHNVKMLLFRPYLSYYIQNQKLAPDIVKTVVDKCLSSAKRTIEIMYDTFRVHVFFRTWFYNCVYCSFAVSILLLYTIRVENSSVPANIRFVEMAVEILEAMDESVVARKSAEIIKHYLGEAQNSGIPAPPAVNRDLGRSDPIDMGANIGFPLYDYSFNQDMASFFAELSGPSGPLEILIVGAGLSGLGAAISCAAAGHHVRVLEAVKELAEIGAGLQITPNASRILDHWGIQSSVLQPAEPTVVKVHRYSGELLAQEDDFDKKIRKRYGSPFIDVYRSDLQKALFSRAVELGVKFNFNERVESVDFSGPTVTTERGNTFSGDLVIAADGLWSRCRDCFMGKKDGPEATGDLAYRILLPIEDIKDERLRRVVENPEVHFWIGPNAHVVAYSLRGGTAYNIVLLVPGKLPSHDVQLLQRIDPKTDDLPPGVSKLEGSIEEMKSLFTEWDPVTCPQVQPWLYGYDAIKEAEQAILPDETPSSAKEGEILKEAKAWWPLRLSLRHAAFRAISAVPKAGVLATAVPSFVRINAQIPKAVFPRRFFSDDASSDLPPVRNTGRNFTPKPRNFPPSETIYVGNIFFELSADDLKQDMSQFGNVEGVRIIYDNRGLSRGFGYVTFDTIEAAERAIAEMNMRVYQGRRVVVNFAASDFASKNRGPNVIGDREPTTTLFVGNLSFEMTDADLNELFKGIQGCEDIRVAVDKLTGRPRGFAHLDFTDLESSKAAHAKLTGMAPYGRELRVNYGETQKRRNFGRRSPARESAPQSEEAFESEPEQAEAPKSEEASPSEPSQAGEQQQQQQ
ncbi:hypothetical protein FQN50_003115 [Emmonsiellopsis sp. PD_5]|nr:hypothetical protein FQN50_003115 [Emmonsiellopsis sp. PD_5]